MTYLDFSKGLIYPWNKPIRLLNILWFLIPVIGWLALVGYGANIIRSIVRGNTKELPIFGNFWENFKVGIMLFLRLIPLTIVVMALNIVPVIGQLASLLANLLLVPYLTMNVVMKRSLSASFEVQNAWSAVTKDFGGYVLTVLKSIAYLLIYGIASLVLVGIPCLAFGGYIFYADWFSKRWKR
jgi:hypothetical protein